MTTDEILAQVELLVGELKGTDRELMKLFCAAAAQELSARLKTGITPAQCETEFPVAAALYAVAHWVQGGSNGTLAEFRAGDLVVKPGDSTATGECLMRQALALLRPYLRDNFCFQGV